jgi:hypothetical protein
MKHSFINFQYDPQGPGEQKADGPIASTQPIAAAGTPPNDLVSKLLEANVQRSAVSSTVVMNVMVKNISNWKPTANGNLPVNMIVTDKGNFWPLASAIKNAPAALPQPMQAKATFVLRKDRNGNDVLNISQLEFETTMDNRTAQMIAAMKTGTALFAA